MLVIFADAIKRTWKQIIYFNKDKEVGNKKAKEDIVKTQEKLKISKKHNMSQELQDVLKGDIISDERGVRVARMVDEDSD